MLVAGVLGAFVVFVAQSLSWLVLGVHDGTIHRLPNGDAIAALLREAAPAPGIYHHPGMPLPGSRSRPEPTCSMLRRKRGPARHWWLTGFKWGEFAQPSELTMKVTITFVDVDMRKAFHTALSNRGYKNATVTGNAVSFTFDSPYMKQPVARIVGGPAMQDENKKKVQLYRTAMDGAGLLTNNPNHISEAAKTKKVFDIVAPFVKLFGASGGTRKH